MVFLCVLEPFSGVLEFLGRKGAPKGPLSLIPWKFSLDVSFHLDSIWNFSTVYELFSIFYRSFLWYFKHKMSQYSQYEVIVDNANMTTRLGGLKSLYEHKMKEMAILDSITFGIPTFEHITLLIHVVINRIVGYQQWFPRIGRFPLWSCLLSSIFRYSGRLGENFLHH